MELGNKIKSLRLAAKMTQEELAAVAEGQDRKYNGSFRRQRKDRSGC